MLALFLLLFSSQVYAAGGSGGPADLIFPAINLSILLGLLIYKLKGLMSDMFKKNAQEIKDNIESAAIKAKEAEMMMEMQQKKMAGADDEVSKMRSEADDLISRYEIEYKTEVEHRINKLKEDAGQKIEAERKELLDKLNASLLDQVLSNTKNKLQNDKALSESATANILGR
ncbi:MAG: hypothetical protein CME62_17135 [Halobacteriovoraceae bacterium]|nr:hypothetical protein [Halobacteriovoraceae bacterium]|tara:strand:+ start:5241 stop:5756 length:516 start_codon:yes stop_codon:yes gene_type:complete